MSNTVTLDGQHLTLEALVQVARQHAKVALDEQAIAAVNRARDIVEAIVAAETPTYGINTGFGSLQSISISKEECQQLQENLIRTHSCGYGEPFAEDVVRAIMLIRVNSLLKGSSGIRLSTLELLVAMLNRNVVPHIPEKGSLGASGDLAPLSHMVLPMLGLGRAYL